MQRFHIVYRLASEFTTTGVVVESSDIIGAIKNFYEQLPEAHILSINTQELVDLMASSRG